MEESSKPCPPLETRRASRPPADTSWFYFDLLPQLLPQRTASVTVSSSRIQHRELSLTTSLTQTQLVSFSSSPPPSRAARSTHPLLHTSLLQPSSNSPGSSENRNDGFSFAVPRSGLRTTATSLPSTAPTLYRRAPPVPVLWSNTLRSISLWPCRSRHVTSFTCV